MRQVHPKRSIVDTRSLEGRTTTRSSHADDVAPFGRSIAPIAIPFTNTVRVADAKEPDKAWRRCSRPNLTALQYRVRMIAAQAYLPELRVAPSSGTPHREPLRLEIDQLTPQPVQAKAWLVKIYGQCRRAR